MKICNLKKGSSFLLASLLSIFVACSDSTTAADDSDAPEKEKPNTSKPTESEFWKLSGRVTKIGRAHV